MPPPKKARNLDPLDPSPVLVSTSMLSEGSRVKLVSDLGVGEGGGIWVGGWSVESSMAGGVVDGGDGSFQRRVWIPAEGCCPRVKEV